MTTSASPLRRPAGFLFDYGETLVVENRFDRVAGTRRLLELATDRNGRTVEEVVDASLKLWADHERRRQASLLEVSVVSFQRLLYHTLGVTFDLPHEQLAREFWIAAVSTSAMLGAADLLSELATNSVPVGVVSNTAFGTDIVRGELAKHGLDRYVRFVIGSSDYGVRKPHPALFRLGAAKLNLPPEHIWFVGDSIECDVAGARAVGMTSILLKRAATPPRCDADVVVKTLAEVGELYRNARTAG